MIRSTFRQAQMVSRFLMAMALMMGLAGSAAAQDVPPPRPQLPIPTERQLDWQQDELRLFLHFGVNTFSNREWGTGDEDPSTFNPTALDAGQWARVAREAGFRTIILTAKHHDGFALWPSAYTDHSVERSPWRGGNGDVVRELVDAAHAEGLKVGLYLSPWDRHEPSYGNEDAYNAYYMAQLRELLTGYGPIAEVWFDGAKGEDARDMDYDFEAWWALVRQLQPGAVMFSDAGPDVRWIGNEHGFARNTNWSTFDKTKVGIGMAGIGDYLNTGEAGTPDWVPGECDVSIRPGWFWHPEEEPKSLEHLLEIYFKSVGRNCLLLLNVPPTTEGLLDERDVARLIEFRTAINRIFAHNLAAGAIATASGYRGGSATFDANRILDDDAGTYWAAAEGDGNPAVVIELTGAVSFNVIRLEEPIEQGQRVSAYRVDAWVDDAWTTISRGTTVGYRKLDRLETVVTTDRIRLVIEASLADPLLSGFGLFLDPFASGN